MRTFRNLLDDWWSDSGGDPLGLLGGAKKKIPSDISGLLLWLKADAGTYQDAGITPATADGSPVGQWRDQSGNNVHYARTVAAQKPLLKLSQQNSLPAVRFDGAVTDGDYLTSALLSSPSGSFTFYYVGKPNTTANKILFDVQTGRLIVSTNSAGGNIGFYDGAWKESSSPSEAAWQIDTWTLLANGNGQIFKNGVLVGTIAYAVKALGGNSSIGAATAGTSQIANDVGELIVYSGCHSFETRCIIERYLSSRWGIVVTETAPTTPTLTITMTSPNNFHMVQR